MWAVSETGSFEFLHQNFFHSIISNVNLNIPGSCFHQPLFEQHNSFFLINVFVHFRNTNEADVRTANAFRFCATSPTFHVIHCKMRYITRDFENIFIEYIIGCVCYFRVISCWTSEVFCSIGSIILLSTVLQIKLDSIKPLQKVVVCYSFWVLLWLWLSWNRQWSLNGICCEWISWKSRGWQEMQIWKSFIFRVYVSQRFASACSQHLVNSKTEA